MHVGRTSAASTTHAGHGTASSWFRRHARHGPKRWERPSLTSSRAAAKTISTVLAVGGASCWEVAIGLYADALATHSIGRRGEVALRERHTTIARILTALTQSTAAGAPHERAAQRMARDVQPAPRDAASNEEHEAMAMACEAVLRVMLAVGEFEKALRCARRWARVSRSPIVERRVIHTLLLETAGGEGKEEDNPEQEDDGDKSAVSRASLLRCGFLPCIEAVRKMPALAALLSLRAEGLPNHCVVRWYVDAAVHMRVNPWTKCFSQVPPTGAASKPFYREMLEYCCSHCQLPLPAAALDAIPRSVLHDTLAAAMRCCQEELGEVERRRLQDVISAAIVASPLPRREAIVCLDLFSRQFCGGVIPQEKEVWWWCTHLWHSLPDSVESATTWVALCQRIGVGELMMHLLPSTANIFPLLVVQASQSGKAAEALFAALQQGAPNPPVVDDLPHASARSLLLLCADDSSASVVQWTLRYCKDREYLVQFVLDHLESHRDVAAQVLRVMLQPEHADVFGLFSAQLSERSSTWLSRLASLAPRNRQWVVALRCLQGMGAPSIAHLHVAFLALAAPCTTPFSVGVDFVWADDSLLSLQAEVNPSLWHIDAAKWEAALLFLSIGAEHMSHRSDLLRCYASVVSRAATATRQAHASVEDLIARMTTDGASVTVTSVREQLAALVRRKQWMEACVLLGQFGGSGATRDLVGLLAHHGRWVEASRVVATERKAAWVPLLIRAACNAGHWRAAVWTVEKAASERMPLHSASIAELLACCASADVTLEAIQLWRCARAGGAATPALICFGKDMPAATKGRLSKTRMELLFVSLDSSRCVNRQWHYALQLLTSQVLRRNAPPSSRLFYTTFSILRRAGRWEESLQLRRFQQLLGVPATAKMAGLVADALPPSEWETALTCLQGELRGDAGLLCHVVPKVLPANWECALRLVSTEGSVTNTALECVVGCEHVPLKLRLEAWLRLLPSLPVSMRHRAAPVYLHLSLAVSEHGRCLLAGVDGLSVLERSIRGLRHDFLNYGAFVYHRAVVHHHWCHTSLDPVVGVRAFRALSSIAERDVRCEVSVAALEQLSDLVGRQPHAA
ncbi:hypothetical protein TRSC58_04196 [Trypanosoma rangeli SC58]|uniref:Uncharacterized protein n=1 Tax=Trypanosoma rangeli SC58 TaxID=429131 RepID=A0A061J4A1_TRYRA|nr:hypothetical protein TRSC58_04196 [Trypanosoma rangeli SC58]